MQFFFYYEILTSQLQFQACQIILNVMEFTRLKSVIPIRIEVYPTIPKCVHARIKIGH